ncbi:MAG TPA: kinase [Kiritimatiellia bacterium]|nr:kinase [Kiritimatiellia bacterium]
MIIARTPFRISFFGGGTDFPGYFEHHGGAVLATTINKYCYISVHQLTSFFKHRFRASYSRTESVLSPEEFQHPLIRETLLHLDQREGVEISHVADLPGQTGLGSSSSFTVGLLHALHGYLGRSITAEELARQAIHIERVRVGDAGGWQDQYEAAFGGFRRFDFEQDGSVRVTTISLTPERRAELENNLTLFYLGTESSAEQILQDQKKRADANEATLHAMRAMVDEGERILSGAGSLAAFGDLLDEAWRLKRSLATGISNRQIDQAYETARTVGARGGKLLGAGGRGFLCLYAEPSVQPALRDALHDLREVHFGFSNEGSRIIFKSDE